MRTLQRTIARGPSTTSPAVAARVVVTGGVVVVASVALAVALGGGLVLAGVVALVTALVAAVLARRTLSSLFAGLTLLLARPYSTGEHIRLFVPEVGEVADAEVIKLGVVSTTLITDDGVLVVPNTRMLRAAPECRHAA